MKICEKHLKMRNVYCEKVLKIRRQGKGLQRNKEYYMIKIRKRLRRVRKEEPDFESEKRSEGYGINEGYFNRLWGISGNGK